jgi:hypothetical protein
MTDQWSAKRKKALQIEEARRQSGESIWYMLCLKNVRTALQLPGGTASAKLAWQAVDSDDKYPKKLPPPGVPAWMDKPGGSRYGHIVLVAKTGTTIRNTLVYSNDIKAKGKISLVSVGYILDHWGMEWLGWATTLNGERIHPRVPHDG